MKSKLKLGLFGAMSLIGLVCVGLTLIADFCLMDVSYENRYRLFMLGIVLVVAGGMYFVQEYDKIKLPEVRERLSIEQGDERNVLIKYKAQSKAGQIVFYMNFVFTLIHSFHLLDNFWLVWCPVCSVILYSILRTIFYNKYYKE